MRTGMILLGLGLMVLWIVGLANYASTWMVWLNFCAAILSLLAGALPARAGMGTAGTTGMGAGSRRFGVLEASPFALCVGLLVLWIAGLAAAATSWLVWWNFAFAIAYGLLGVAVGIPEDTLRRTTYSRPHQV